MSTQRAGRQKVRNGTLISQTHTHIYAAVFLKRRPDNYHFMRIHGQPFLISYIKRPSLWRLKRNVIFPLCPHHFPASCRHSALDFVQWEVSFWVKYRALELSWGTVEVFKGLKTLRVSLKEADEGGAVTEASAVCNNSWMKGVCGCQMTNTAHVNRYIDSVSDSTIWY